MSTKSTRNPPKGHPCLEVLLSQAENDLFEITKQDLRYSNLPKEEWRAIRSLGDDRSIIIKKVNKGLCIVVWDRSHYVLETEKQLSDLSVYRDASNSENILPKLLEASNKMFSSLRRKGFITEKNLNILHSSIKRYRILVKYTYFPNSISNFLMSPGHP